MVASPSVWRRQRGEVVTTWSAEGDPQLAAIRRAVLVILRVGLRPAKLLGEPEALKLSDGWAPQTATALDRVFVVEARFRDALGRLGNGPHGEAARLLFGADDETRGLPLKTRRAEAANEIGVYPSTFRRLYEDDLIGDVIAELVRPG